VSRIRFTAQAREYWLDIWLYISEHNSESIADRVYDSIESARRLLANNPLLGRVRPEIRPEATKSGGDEMTVTQSFKSMVEDRLARDPGFREALLRESIDTMLAGDVETGKAALRDYIKATIGFTALAEGVGTPSKSLIRMFGPKGNPTADNLFKVVSHLQKRAGIELHIA
jgi:plasmid stabilization system protein ParE